MSGVCIILSHMHVVEEALREKGRIRQYDMKLFSLSSLPIASLVSRPPGWPLTQGK